MLWCVTGNIALIDVFFIFYLKECQKKLEHKLGLDSYLLKPIQRLTKYQLLLKVRKLNHIMQMYRKSIYDSNVFRSQSACEVGYFYFHNTGLKYVLQMVQHTCFIQAHTELSCGIILNVHFIYPGMQIQQTAS